MILGLIGLAILIFFGAFLKSLDFNPFNFLFGIKKSTSSKVKSDKPTTQPIDPNLTWEQWENEHDI